MNRWNIIAYRDPLGQREYKAKVAEDGEWVKYSDAMDAIGKAQVDMARCNREGDDAVIRAKNEEIEKLQARVRELEEQVKDMIPMPKFEVEQNSTIGTVVRMNDVLIWHEVHYGALGLDSSLKYRDKIINALRGTP